MTARDWIEKLSLVPHPEGGWYRETYRAEEIIQRQKKEKTQGGEPPAEKENIFRSAATAIYFLLEGKQISKLHRIASDEIWHFYDGGPLVIAMISPEGRAAEICLGRNPEKGEMPQAVVPAGVWFGAFLAQPDSFALVGCTVAPGFEFRDLEFADPAVLPRQFSEHRALIDRLTKKPV